MRTREQLLAEINTWMGVNPHIVHNARKELDELDNPIKEVVEPLPTTMSYDEARIIAKGMSASDFTSWVKEKFGIVARTEKSALKQLKDILE